MDYGAPSNWIVNESYSNPAGREYDLFYIYPTLVSDPDKPLMDMSDPKVELKTLGFVTAQVELFKGSRQFAPYVRQLEYHRSMEYLGGDKSLEPLMQVGMDDAVAAFRHYLSHWNNGRPYILFGHSQGSVNLYETMKRCPEIRADRGFVAAYLLGLPFMTGKKILADFAGRGIAPARGADDEPTIQRRLANAAKELDQAHWFNAWIVNEDLETAYDELRAAYIAPTKPRPRRLKTSNPCFTNTARRTRAAATSAVRTSAARSLTNPRAR